MNILPKPPVTADVGLEMMDLKRKAETLEAKRAKKALKSIRNKAQYQKGKAEKALKRNLESDGVGTTAGGVRLVNRDTLESVLERKTSRKKMIVT